MENSPPHNPFLLVLIFCFFLPQGNSSGQDYFLISDIRGQRMERDPLGNVYIIDRSSITKYDESLRKICTFSSQELGEISWADVRDPFRILLYYRDYNTLLVADNQLSLMGSPISFPDLGFPSVRSVCAATGGGIWILNGMNRRLQLLDKQYKVILESEDISAYYTIDGETGKMSEISRKVWIHFPGNGVVSCDRYGAILGKIDLPEAMDVQLEGDWIYYPWEKGVSVYSRTDGLQYFPLTQDEAVLDVLITQTRILALCGKGLRVYSHPGQVFGK